MNDPEQITYFAETDARNRRVPFGIKAKDRAQHLYVIGKTGVGKSTLLENMAIQDIRNGNGLCFIDPHGKTADLLLNYIPENRINDVLYFAPFDMDYPISFNVMEDVGYDKRHLVASGLMSTFKKIWQDMWSARMEYILSNTILALLEYPDATLLSVSKMYSDKKFREKVLENVSDVSVKSFWVDEFAKYTERFAQEATPAIQNKIGQFTSNPLIRNIIGQPKSTFDFRGLMDNRKIVIVNLSKGRVGETNTYLLGGMLVTKIYLAAMSRSDKTFEELEKLPNFYLYVDEFQSFANESFADILSEARKYKLNLNITHQYIEQMPEEVRNAVFGNVGTMITFRVGATDAEYLEKEFFPTFNATDLVSLGKYQIYLKLMIDNVSSHPFSAQSLPPLEKPAQSFTEKIIQTSRNQFARPRVIVEKEIKELIGLGRENDEEKKKFENKNSKDKKPRKNQDNKNQIQNQNQRKKEDKNEREQRLEPMIDEETKKSLEEALKQRSKIIYQKPEKSEKSLEEESLSLQKLSRNNKKEKRGNGNDTDPKEATKENSDSLKAALEAALGGAINTSKEVSGKKEDKKPENNEIPAQGGEDKGGGNGEIKPEDLKKILD
jgi:hypothetical protein